MGIADEAALYALGYWMHENHPARVDGLCLNSIQRKTPCDECSTACPIGLSIHMKVPDWHGCIDCELCVTACPAQAINPSSARSDRVENAVASAHGCVVLACERYGGAADATVACLAALPWDELAAYALRIPVVLKTSPCKECEHSCQVAQVKDTLGRLRGFFGPDEFAKRVFPRVPADLAAKRDAARVPGAERRRAFSTVAGAVRKGAANLAEPTQPPSVSRSRAMLLEVLEEIPEPQRPVFHWKTLVEDGACKGCGICVNMCPHGALSLVVSKPCEPDDVCDPCGEAASAGEVLPADAASFEARDRDVAHGKAPFEERGVVEDAASCDSGSSCRRGGSAASQPDRDRGVADADSRGQGGPASSQPPVVPRYLAHDASRCTQCGLCYMSCPPENLGGWDELAASTVPAVRFNPIDVAVCEKCGRLFKAEPGRTRCPACSRFRFAPR